MRRFGLLHSVTSLGDHTTELAYLVHTSNTIICKSFIVLDYIVIFSINTA